MKKIKLRKNLLSGLGVIILSATGVFLYFVYKKLKKVKLTKWLEDYIDEIQILIKSEKFKELSLETLSRIYIYKKR